MRENILLVTITVILVLLATSIIFISMTIDAYNKLDTVETVDNSVENCEHDWVVSSEYSWYRNAYRIISKCSKCGKVVK
mgnify:CR=1 FL=1